MTKASFRTRLSQGKFRKAAIYLPTGKILFDKQIITGNKI
jgi:hypothetical protein